MQASTIKNSASILARGTLACMLLVGAYACAYRILVGTWSLQLFPSIILCAGVYVFFPSVIRWIRTGYTEGVSWAVTNIARWAHGDSALLRRRCPWKVFRSSAETICSKSITDLFGLSGHKVSILWSLSRPDLQSFSLKDRTTVGIAVPLLATRIDQSRVAGVYCAWWALHCQEEQSIIPYTLSAEIIGAAIAIAAFDESIALPYLRELPIQEQCVIEQQHVGYQGLLALVYWLSAPTMEKDTPLLCMDTLTQAWEQVRGCAVTLDDFASRAQVAAPRLVAMIQQAFPNEIG